MSTFQSFQSLNIAHGLTWGGYCGVLGHHPGWIGFEVPGARHGSRVAVATHWPSPEVFMPRLWDSVSLPLPAKKWVIIVSLEKK